MWAEALAKKKKNKGWRLKEEGNKDGAHNSDEATFFLPVCLDVMLESQSHFMVES